MYINKGEYGIGALQQRGIVSLRDNNRCDAFGTSRIGKIPGNTWKYLEIPGNTWKHLETPGNTWKYLEIPGNTWKHLETPGNTWKYLEIPGNTWNYLEIPGACVFGYDRSYFDWTTIDLLSD